MERSNPANDNLVYDRFGTCYSVVSFDRYSGMLNLLEQGVPTYKALRKMYPCEVSEKKEGR